ncbi:hypothetical protein DSM88_25710 [Salmonella enterica subsp. enterica]|nr:hypothetical protein [Salmonella enterica subsp. enterica]
MRKAPSESVINELNKRAKEILELCEKNDIPVVFCYSFELNRNENGYLNNKSITAYINKEKGACDSTIAAASMILRMKEVPEIAIHAMAEMAAICDITRTASGTSDEKSLH